MQVLAIGIVADGVTDDQMSPHMPAERARGGQLAGQGLIRQTWQRADRAGVVMLLDSPTLQEAEQGLGSLPLAQAGFTSYEYIPLKP